jgi:hypothetical protein
MLEPRIEHAVAVDEVGRGRAVQGAPGGEADVLPEPVDDDGVIVAGVRLEPRQQALVVAVARDRGAGRDHLARIVDDEAGVGAVQTHEVAFVPHDRQRIMDPPDSLDGASAPGIDGWNEVKQSHDREARLGKISSLG